MHQRNRCARRRHIGVVSAGSSVLAALFLSPAAISHTSTRDPGVRSGQAAAGDPLPGLTTGQLAAFNAGKDAFKEASFVTHPPADGGAGLGPGFNSDSCGSCHDQPAAGGTSPAVNPQVEVATKLGARNKIPWFISQDGPVREVRFIRAPDGTPDGGVHNLFVVTGRTDARGCDIQQDDFSNRANLSFRIPTPTFGLGLVESIADYVLADNLKDNGERKAALGISGRLNRSENDGSITRFGWKAQIKSLMIFAGEAYSVEQGVSNPLFPQERNETKGCVYNDTPEDNSDFDANKFEDISMFAAFMRFLAPPARGPINGSVTAGANAFETVGCALCHTPELTTEGTGVAALKYKPVRLFSDLAIHRMGPGLADHVSQGKAGGDDFRTAPLWGLGQRIFFLHDGRTNDLMEAIRAHASKADSKYPASEANAVVQRFNQMTPEVQQHLLNFLRSL